MALKAVDSELTNLKNSEIWSEYVSVASKGQVNASHLVQRKVASNPSLSRQVRFEFESVDNLVAVFLASPPL